MFQIPRVPPLLHRLARPLGQMLLTFLLSAAQLSHAYAPGALAVTALAGPGLGGLFALLGAAGGALVFFDFQSGLRFLASAILIFSANTAFYDTQFYRRAGFRPAASVAAAALVQSVWLLARPLRLTTIFLLSLAAQWAAFRLLQPLWEPSAPRQDRQRACLLLLFAAALALVPLESSGGFSLGRSAMALPLLALTAGLTPSEAAAMGFAAGLAADLTAAEPVFLYTAAAACGCALSRTVPRRWLAALLYCVGIAGIALLFGADKPELFLWEGLGGAALWLLLPQRLPAANATQAAPAPPALSEPRSRLEQSAAAFRDLYDSFFRGTEPQPPENPSVIFDRTAQQVCRKCVLCHDCWHRDYNTTYSAFNDAYPALLRRGQALAQDFPLHFSSRCVHMQAFVTALNGELRSFLLRRQYHRRLSEARQQAQEQYAQLGDLLSDAAAVEAMGGAPMGYRIGSSLRPREGCRVCGDQLAVFEVGSTLYLLLSDGMGSGENAHREAAMTVRLLRQFLEAGISPAPALQTLNTAMALRGEAGGGFTTIDLLALHRSSGSASLYKYGAAPSYLKRSGTVTRFTAASLPAGLQNGAQGPECSRFALPGGSYFVMVSDGIADEGDDEWLQNLLAGWNGSDADALTRLIMAESRSRKGTADDCAVLVLCLAPPENGGKSPI